MQGPALAWFKWMHSNQQITTWEAFTHALKCRFGPSTYENHQVALFKLRQSGYVMEYQTQFEMLANRVMNLSPDAQLNCFLSGLKPEIYRELTVLRPYNLTDAIGMAKLVESKLADARSASFRSNRSQPPITHPPNSKPSILGAGPTPTASSLPIRNFSQANLQERRAKGLCFYYDDKFVPGHRCKQKQFMILLTEEEDPPPEIQTDPQSEETTEDIDLETQQEAPSDSMHFYLSHVAFGNAPSPRTLRAHGTIQGLQVTTLVDSGSSHNIIQPRVAEFLKLPIEAFTPFSITVGNGQAIHCQGFCKAVPIILAGELFHIPMFVLPIHGADVVLGVQWLQTLNRFISDYNVPLIEFTHNSKTITLTGIQPTHPTQASFAQFCRFMFTDVIHSAHTVSLHYIEQEPLPTEASKPCHPLPKNPELATLLSTYSDVFEVPKGLPPHRSKDHHIHLLPTASPVNVRPYRYPHCQKTIMTTMIQDMLREGLIQPSTSPFSSPVLLVKKMTVHGDFVLIIGLLTQ